MKISAMSGAGGFKPRSYHFVPIENRVRLSFPDNLRLAGELASVVAASDFKPDNIVAIAHKGLVPGKFISDALGVSLIPVHVSRQKNTETGITHDYVVQKYASPPVLFGKFEIGRVSGTRTLVVDDNINTGGSILAVCAMLLEKGMQPDDVRVAVISDMGEPKFADHFLTDVQFMTPGGHYSLLEDDLLYKAWMTDHFPEYPVELKAKPK